MYDIEKVMATFADCENLSDDCFCLAVCPFEWRNGDRHIYLYGGKSLRSCVDYAIADQTISLKSLKRTLYNAGWEAVARGCSFDDDEIDNLSEQFSPWDFATIYEAMALLDGDQIVKVVGRASLYRNCELWRVGALRDFLTGKK